MKRKSTLVLVCLIPILLLASTTALAKYKTDVEGLAYGTFENYRGYPSDAEIVSGFWSLKIQDGQVWYYARVLEKNLLPSEGAPIDSADILEYTMIGKPFSIEKGYDETLDTEYVKVFATYQVTKIAAKLDGTYTTKTWTTWSQIEVYANGDVIDNNNPYDDTWYKEGEVLYQDFF